jgi:uncharacterized repeat protein (TIGR03803 family)
VNDHSAGFVFRVCMVVLLLGALVPASRAQAQTLTTLYSFCAESSCLDGELPTGSLVQAPNGHLYGTTLHGGTSGGADLYAIHGTVFEITPSGTLTTLHRFCEQNGCLDGDGPSSLALAANGDLYGTTVNGGAYGHGTVFKFTPGGVLTTLYSFCRQGAALCPDGYGAGALVQAANGDLYGTTSNGGVNSGGASGGTIFKITPSGTLTTLYSFCALAGCADGYFPSNGLVQAADGNFYGTTQYGPAQNGTVFKITLSGELTTLHVFCSLKDCLDGSYPQAGLVQAANGELYGSAHFGGTYGYGTIYKITTSGTLTTLHSFCKDSGCPDGAYPVTALVQGTDGSLYGTTVQGGVDVALVYGSGTAFKITPNGELTTLYDFCTQSECTDGEFPSPRLLQATNGNLYGTTGSGGVYGANGEFGGTIFQLSVGLGPFVETLPNLGKAGAVITILGTDLTGASGVTFNATAASFSVISASAIQATVPAGATTGVVQVTTPGGVLSSNGMFRVNP